MILHYRILHRSKLWIALWTFLQVKTSLSCNLCPEGSEPGVPFATFEFLTGEIKTCQELADDPDSIPADECERVQEEAAFLHCFCGGIDNGCRLCESGTLPNPELPLDETTCRRIEDFARFEEGSDKCDAYRAVSGIYCGCDNPNALASNPCRICGGNTLLPFPDLAFDIDGGRVTCAELELQGQATGECFRAQEVGQEACCVHECTLCRDGSIPATIPDEEIPLFIKDTETTFSCTEAFTAVSAIVGDSTDCLVAQAYALEFCGCPDISAPTKAPTEPEFCTLCPDGTDPPEPDRLLSFTATMIAPDGTETCGSLAAFYETTLKLENPSGRNSCVALQRSLGVGMCGCEPPEGICTLCSDNDFPTNLLGTLSDGTECEVLMLSYPIQEAALGDDGDLLSCPELQVIARDRCGCPNRPDPPANPGCTLCRDGSFPKNPTAEVDDEFTCEELFYLFPFRPDDNDCIEDQEDAISICGCPDIVETKAPTEAPTFRPTLPPVQECTLCIDESNVSFPQQVLPPEFSEPPYSVDTCGDLQASPAVAALVAADQTCVGKIQREVGFGLCGCPPIPGVCVLCAEGTPAPLLNTGNLTDGTSCLNAAQKASTYASNSNECRVAQGDGFLSCGCTTLPPPPTNPTCTLCSDGSVPLNPNGLITQPQAMRCKEAFTLFQFIEDPTQCSAAQAEAAETCGCPMDCTLCPDGSAPPDALARFLTGPQTLTCQAVYERQPWKLPKSNCTLLQQRGREVCSCGEQLLPPSQCQLCENGTIPQPLHRSYGDRTCAESAVDARRGGANNCMAWQATAGIWCGCPGGNPIARSSKCELCTTKALPNREALLPTLFNGRNVTCGQVELQANLDGKSRCNSTRTLFAQYCCDESLRQHARDATSAANGIVQGLRSYVYLAGALMLFVIF